MDKICKYGRIHGRVSPVCGDYELYKQLERISVNRGVDFGLMIGIVYAESHIGANFAPNYENCKQANNRAGIKRDAYKNRNFRKGCSLHQFESIQDFRSHFSLIVKGGYIDRGCSNPECIARRRVRGDGTLNGKQGWINRVNLFFLENTYGTSVSIYKKKLIYFI